MKALKNYSGLLLIYSVALVFIFVMMARVSTLNNNNFTSTPSIVYEDR